jgi:hypothetical protein
MRARASLIAALIAALLALTACTGPGPASAPQRDTPDRGGDDRGGGMM